MNRQNITLSIPKDLLQRAKILAVKRNTSMSAFMTQLLAEAVTEEDKYAVARQRHLTMLESGFNLGTMGLITWGRDELYER